MRPVSARKIYEHISPMVVRLQNATPLVLQYAPSNQKYMKIYEHIGKHKIIKTIKHIVARVAHCRCVVADQVLAILDIVKADQSSGSIVLSQSSQEIMKEVQR